MSSFSDGIIERYTAPGADTPFASGLSNPSLMAFNSVGLLGVVTPRRRVARS